MNSIRITLISLFIASSAYAEEIVKFVSLDACKVYYAKSVTPVANETADTYCKDRIMSFLEACTATKIAEYVKAQNLASFSVLSDSEQRNKKVTFSYQCQVASQNEAAGNALKAAQAKAASTVTTSSGGTTPAAAAAAATQQKVAQGQMAVQLAQQSTKIIENIDKATQKGAATAQPQQAGGNGGTAAAPASNNAGATAGAAGKDAVAAKPAGDTAAPAAQTTTAAPATEAAAQPAAAAAKPADFSELSKESLDKYTADAAAAKSKVGAEAADVGKIDPKLGDKAEGVAQKADSSGTTAPATEISAQAKATTTEMQGKVNGAVTAAKPLAVAAGAPAFTQTTQTLNDYKGQVDGYYTNKETCKNAAENASFLCVESTSPGAVAAKELMNAAGPVLAIISSAQKTCSSTAKVTKLVNTGLVIARGVCVAAKIYCDVSCGKAKVDITKIGVQFKAKYLAAVRADYANGQQRCMQLDEQAVADYGASTPLATACHSDLETKQSTAQSVGPQMQTALDTEATVKPGTSPEIAVKCTSMAKDIALLAVQAAGTFAAYKNAQACEEKLAASGSAAANVTTQQYCEKSENVSTQLCVCQKNPMASGCPGAVVTDSSASGNGSSDKGTNIKGVGGNSAFAGGFGSGSKSNPGNLSLGKDSINSALNSASGDGSTGGADGFGGGGMAGGGSGAGGLGGAPAGSQEAALKKEAEEKKKWSFGAFGSDSGIGGSGNAGAGANGKFKSGALTTGDQAAIQRQIASEKYAAEVSTASGKSNWEKIRNMYLIKENSFIFGQ